MWVHLGVIPHIAQSFEHEATVHRIRGREYQYYEYSEEAEVAQTGAWKEQNVQKYIDCSLVL
jgi:hypothetical protein